MSFNTAVAGFDRGLTEHCGTTTIKVALEGCLWSLGVQQRLGSFSLSSSTV